jgi:hypothetical protein
MALLLSLGLVPWPWALPPVAILAGLCLGARARRAT